MTDAGKTTAAEAATKPLLPLDRAEMIARVKADPVWDVVVIGAGATGAGIAVDAASRGLSTLILDAQDFSAGTSSRSTKLIHGGVRYMKNPRDWGLVCEALHERKILIENAPHLVHAEPFVLPCFKKYEREIYTVGLGIYAAMAGKASLGRTRALKPAEAAARLPGVKTEGLLGGVEFYDAQFDDARLNVALIRTAHREGAACLNYFPVTAVERDRGLIQSITATDAETGETHRIRARCYFNCSGVWTDAVRRLVDPNAASILRCSRGSHVLLEREFLPGEAGMLIPKTRDGRVLFCIPWHDMTLVGTTDVEQREPDMHPEASEEEISFILETASGYLARPVTRADVRASFAGLRPLLRAPESADGSTAKASREHAVIPEFGNMITVAGGKWTSYRRMAEDAMLEATTSHLVKPRLCVTKTLPIADDPVYGAARVEKIEKAAAMGPGADAEVVEYALWSRDNEGARTAEDVLYRRLRLGQMNAERTAKLMPIVAAALAGEPYELEPVPAPEPVVEVPAEPTPAPAPTPAPVEVASAPEAPKAEAEGVAEPASAVRPEAAEAPVKTQEAGGEEKSEEPAQTPAAKPVEDAGEPDPAEMTAALERAVEKAAAELPETGLDAPAGEKAQPENKA